MLLQGRWCKMIIEKIVYNQVYDKKNLKNLEQMNNLDVALFQRYAMNHAGVKVPRKTLEEVALNKLLTCYNKKELIRILQHFQQLPERNDPR